MVLNIAMDGPVGAGKSSIADAVAKRLGILHLDTGAMYRAIGLTALEKGVPVQDEQAVTALCQSLSMTVGHAADGQHTLVDGRDVTGFIRTPEVSMAASTVAKYAGVRAAMVALQRRLAQETPMLVDGRDIGTRVLMNAPVKIFLTASAEERARRRYRQQIEKGFAMYLYDFKFDDLSSIAYNHLLNHLDAYETRPKFCIINFDDPRRSNRCNPIAPEFMTDISDAYESAYTIMLNLNKTWV